MGNLKQKVISLRQGVASEWDNQSCWYSLNLTLKAFTNFSPGLRFGNPGKEAPHSQQTLKGLRRGNTVELRQDQRPSYSQGFKANPGLELANAFGVKFKLRQR
jgi:hypothetical protein